jgi:hypothetical protein
MPFSKYEFEKRSQLVKAESAHDPDVDSNCETLACSIIDQWPDRVINAGRLVAIDPKHLDVDRALADVTPDRIHLTRNHDLHTYLERVRDVLSMVDIQSQTKPLTDAPFPPVARVLPYITRARIRDDQSLSELLQYDVRGTEVPEVCSLPAPAPRSYGAALSARSGNVIHRTVSGHDLMSIAPTGKLRYQHHLSVLLLSEIETLGAIVTNSKDPSFFVQCRYMKELEASIDALQKHIMNRKDPAHYAYPEIRTENVLPAKNSAAAISAHIRCTL